MRRFILSLPCKLQAAFIIVATIALAFVCANISGMFYDHHQLVSNTDLIDSVYQTMGTIYAILLTFTLWGVWQNFTDASKSVQSEAYALLDLVHMLGTAGDSKNMELRAAALSYARHVVDEEWSTLQLLTNERINKIESASHTTAIEVMKTVQSVEPRDQRAMVIYNQALALLARWLDARRSRMLIARGDSTKALWPLLMTGAIVLFAFHGLFVANTLSIWISLLFGTSLVIGVTFYLIFSLDCPFAGSLSIDPEPFELATRLLMKEQL